MNFQSGIANNEYINKNLAKNVGKRFLDVYVCGGEFSTKRLAYKELASFLASYASENEDEIEYTSLINGINNFYNSWNDTLALTKMTDKYFEREKLQNFVNYLYEKREALKKMKYSKESKAYIHTLKNEIKAQNRTIAQLGRELEELKKHGKIKINGVNVFIELSQATAETFETYMESLKTAELARQE